MLTSRPPITCLSMLLHSRMLSKTIPLGQWLPSALHETVNKVRDVGIYACCLILASGVAGQEFYFSALEYMLTCLEVPCLRDECGWFFV